MLQRLTLLFPLWMILAGVMALFWPEWLLPLNQGSVVVLILAFVMLCMGLTLTFDDFRRIARMPSAQKRASFDALNSGIKAKKNNIINAMSSICKMNWKRCGMTTYVFEEMIPSCACNSAGRFSAMSRANPTGWPKGSE